MSGRLFILSPANCAGKRGQQLLSPKAGGQMATRLRSDDGVPLGELFAFMSGLYFRGKLAYATRFAVAPRVMLESHGAAGLGTRSSAVSINAVRGVHIITPSHGLRGPDEMVRLDDVKAFAGQAIDLANDAYRQALEASARALLAAAGPCDIVLLGSIASPKYVDVLLGVFGSRLLFPSDFVGRGDMSRGGLLLRQVAAGTELPYIPVAGAERRGTRPPKLPKLANAPASSNAETPDSASGSRSVRRRR
ncbi:MAG: hypothetical protein U0Q11_00305 [Vicinamibacterales bacterium]